LPDDIYGVTAQPTLSMYYRYIESGSILGSNYGYANASNARQSPLSQRWQTLWRVLLLPLDQPLLRP